MSHERQVWRQHTEETSENKTNFHQLPSCLVNLTLANAMHALTTCVSDMLSRPWFTCRGWEASPEKTVEFVVNMSMPSSGDFDDVSVLSINRFLRTRLDAVAAAHGGLVRSQSGLFAQWLCCAFPRDTWLQPL